MTSYLLHKTLYPPLIKKEPSPRLGMIIVIPVYDEPALLNSLQALINCHTPQLNVEAIIVINDSEKDPPEIKSRNRATYEQTITWARTFSTEYLQFHILYFPDLPSKHAGVGLARKIGMDEACRRLEHVGRPEGVILGFDADSLCDPNYLLEVEIYFENHPAVPAASIYFEHPVSGSDYDPKVYQAIMQYELHLRYFINAQAWAGLPYSYQTIGSSMAVRCRAYQQQGGMNRRQAGEDFYFLHKFTPLGHFGRINTTRVIPSPRPSHRVPFGTGRAVGEVLSNNLQIETYAPESFAELRQFIRQVPYLYQTGHPFKVADSLMQFLNSVQVRERLEEMRQNTRSQAAFCKRFFRWFNAFMLMKYVHFMRDHFSPNMPVKEAAVWLMEVSGYHTGRDPTTAELLQLLRSIDREK